MEQLIFTNSRNESVTFGNTKPYILQTFDGFGGVQANVQMQKSPYQDGNTYIDSLINYRSITMTITILTNTPQELSLKKAELARIFNAKLGKGKLKYIYYGKEKEIEAVVDLAPVFPPGKENKGYGRQATMIGLICPSPFWVDTFTSSQEMADWVGGLSFPLKFPTKFAGRSSRQNTVLNNAGDVDTPIEVEFRGYALNPKVLNADTGEFIKVNREIAANEKLIIITEFGNKKVILKNIQTGIETNAFGYIDLDSTFFNLKAGNNQISYDADAGKNGAVVYIRWKNKYIGV